MFSTPKIFLALFGGGLSALGVVLMAEGSSIAGVLMFGVGIAIAYLTLQVEIACSRILQKTNRLHGTQFTRANGFGGRQRIYFDAGSGKALITDGSSARVEDFSAFSSSRLKWRARMRPADGSTVQEDFRVQLTPADRSRPDLEFSCRNKREAEFWNDKLNTYLDPSFRGMNRNSALEACPSN